MANGIERREAAEGYDPESRAYADRYDFNRQADHTDRPEMADDTAMDQALRRMAAAQDEARRQRSEAESRIHFWPNVGRFVIPAENTHAAHEKLVDSGYLTFDPPAYPYTLNVMVEAAKRPDLFDPGHKDFAKNATARRELLILFNDIMGMYMQDGAFDPGDEKYVPQFTSIAQTIGDGLRHEKGIIPRLVFAHMNTEYLNIPGEGAAHAYNFLLDRERDPGFLGGVIRDLRRMSDLPLREWGLPPLSQTPFSKAGLDAPPPADVLCMTEGELVNHCRERCGPCAEAQGEKWQGRVSAQPGAPGYVRAG